MKINNNLEKVKEKDFVADALYLYRKNWKWFVGSIIICLLFAVIFIKIKAPVYSINASLIVKKEDQKASSMMASAMMKSFGVGIGSLMSSESTDDDIEIFSSQDLTKKVVSKLGIYADYQLVKFPVNKDLYKNSPIQITMSPGVLDTLSTTFMIKADITPRVFNFDVKAGKNDLGSFSFKKLPAIIKTPYGSLSIIKNDSIKMTDSYQMNISLNGLNPKSEKLRNAINVSTLNKKTDVIGLEIEDPNRQRGKDILNELIRQYNIDALSDKNKTAFSTATFLKGRIDTLYAEVSQIEQNIQTFKKKNKLIDAKTDVKISLEKYNALQNQNSTLNVQLAMLQAIENQIKDKRQNFDLLPTSIGLPGNVNTFIEKYNDAILTRMRMLRNSNEENPIIQNLNQQISTIGTNLIVSLQNAKKDLNISKSSSIQAENEVNNWIGQLPETERGYVDLRRQQELKSQIYLFLLQKYEETQLTLASSEPKIKIVDNAYALAKPVSPRKIIILPIAFFAGLIFAAIIVCVRILRTERISSLRELQSISNIEVIGLLPNSDAQSTAKYYEKELKTNILKNLDLAASQVILIGSNETSSCTISIAQKIAHDLASAGQKSILVNLDNTQPETVHPSLKTDKRLSDVILNKNNITVSELIYTTDLLNYAVIDAVNDKRLPEIVSNQGFTKLFIELKSNFDRVILNTSSLQSIPDSILLSRYSDMNLFVVNTKDTLKENILQLNKTVDEINIKKAYLIGII